MDNPDEERTIINVKGMRVDSWERARAAAGRAGETMGSWLSRACDQLANLEAGERYIPPSRPAAEVKPAKPEIDWPVILGLLAALQHDSGRVQKRVDRQANAVLYGMLREARGFTKIGTGLALISQSDGAAQGGGPGRSGISLAPPEPLNSR